MPTNTLIILGAFIVIAVVLMGIYWLLRRREKQLLNELADMQQKMSDSSFLEERLKDIQARALAKEQEILEQAQDQANQTVTEAQHNAQETTAKATEQANQLLTEAQTQTKELVDQAASQLTGWQQQMEAEQQAKLGPAFDTAAASISQMPAEVSAKTDKMLEDMHGQMLSEFEQRQKDFDTRMETEWQNVRSEIEQYRGQAKQEVEGYKQAQQQKVDQHISELIGDTLRQTLSVALTPKDQQRIVFEALERAKQDHAFDQSS